MLFYSRRQKYKYTQLYVVQSSLLASNGTSKYWTVNQSLSGGFTGRCSGFCQSRTAWVWKQQARSHQQTSSEHTYTSSDHQQYCSGLVAEWYMMWRQNIFLKPWDATVCVCVVCVVCVWCVCGVWCVQTRVHCLAWAWNISPSKLYDALSSHHPVRLYLGQQTQHLHT